MLQCSRHYKAHYGVLLSLVVSQDILSWWPPHSWDTLTARPRLTQSSDFSEVVKRVSFFFVIFPVWKCDFWTFKSEWIIYSSLKQCISYSKAVKIWVIWNVKYHILMWTMVIGIRTSAKSRIYAGWKPPRWDAWQSTRICSMCAKFMLLISSYC